MADNQDEVPSASAAPGGAKFSLPILPLLNIVAILGTAGFAYYSKIMYKRPAILEDNERERISAENSAPKVASAHAAVQFGPIMANISSYPEKPKPADGTTEQIEGKLHYVTLSFSMEIRDESQLDLIESIRPVFLDRLNHILGKKAFHDLTSVQGRYLLQSQLIDTANQLAASATASEGNHQEALVTNIYFTQFLVQ